ncbi:MAG: hypothetical protein NC310_00310 [Roseburia sp.]|nr:hypothetical protein [Anaeroplasma bactoclasticum]MCM1195495.1 hypothetical protein [Roseburia sp.]MCM1556873.1 hypothetical protein [Anaeroplasma bactoclasticum]
MKKLYKRLFTVQDVQDNFGYDLVAIANRGGFPSEEAACEAWCDEAALAIHSLILKNRGAYYASNIYDFVLQKDEQGNLINEKLYTSLAWAQLYQMLHIIENGNADIQSEEKESVKKYSNDALVCLYNAGILIAGI